MYYRELVQLRVRVSVMSRQLGTFLAGSLTFHIYTYDTYDVLSSKSKNSQRDYADL